MGVLTQTRRTRSTLLEHPPPADVWPCLALGGAYRKSQKNIGVAYYRIPTELRTLLDDCRYWLEHDTYPPDEIAARFHHRLVSIHCYPNGNGRHARLATDLLLTSLERDRFSWGSANLIDAGATRATYVAALRAADNHDYGPLLAFVKS